VRYAPYGAAIWMIYSPRHNYLGTIICCCIYGLSLSNKLEVFWLDDLLDDLLVSLYEYL
jgi:hypothetical protein